MTSPSHSAKEMPRAILAKGREKPVLQRHPWIFSGAFEKFPGIEPGTPVDVITADGRWIARGFGHPGSQLAVRVMTYDPSEAVDGDMIARRLAKARLRRMGLIDPEVTDAYRCVMSEGDGLSGLIVDRYGTWLVVQILSAGMERHKQRIFAELQELFEPDGIFERSDDGVRDKEGLPRVAGIALGGPLPETGLVVREGGLRYLIDPREGHKTGFYLDQRENHERARQIGRVGHALDAFCYTGGFTLSLLAGGAGKVTSLDQSADALARLDENLDLNGLSRDRVEKIHGDAFDALRKLAKDGASFDLIVLDPPKFAKNRAQLQGATRGYKDVNLQAFRLLAPGGRLLTFSCSGHVSPELFQKIVHGAAVDAGRNARVVRHLFQAADHPEILGFPHSLYLKGFELEVE